MRARAHENSREREISDGDKDGVEREWPDCCGTFTLRESKMGAGSERSGDSVFKRVARGYARRPQASWCI